MQTGAHMGFFKYFDITHHPEISYTSPLRDLALVVESSHTAGEGLTLRQQHGFRRNRQGNASLNF